MKYFNNILKLCLMFFILIGLSACGIPSEVLDEAKSIPDKINSSKQNLDSRKIAHEEYMKSADKVFLRTYEKKEKWATYFDRAYDEIKHAESLNEKIVPIIKADKIEQEAELKSYMNRVNKALQQVNINLRKLEDRKKFIIEAKSNSKKWLEDARENFQKSGVIYKPLKQLVDKVLSDPAFVKKKEKINLVLSPVTKLYDDSKEALKKAENELSKGDNADYAKLGDSVKLVENNFKTISSDAVKVRNKLAELYKSYSKTLVDMKTEYFVTIGRTSWDEEDDWPTEHITKFQRQTDDRVFEYFDSVTIDPIATYSTFWGGSSSVYIDRGMWNSLRIGFQDNWPSSWDDEAEFWIADTNAKFYHKYAIEENGKVTYSGWQLVSESVYWSNEDNLGMTILSKPYGYFEDEKIQQAMPPGIAYVGNPKYGEERKDPITGKSVWHYYGQYAFFRDLLGPSYHYPMSVYHDWDTNYRGRKPYYGSSDRFGTYGYATWENSRYSNSDFGKRNLGVRKEVYNARTERKTRLRYSDSNRSKSRVNKTQGKTRNAGIASRNKGPGRGK